MEIIKIFINNRKWKIKKNEGKKKLKVDRIKKKK
jgi:hypothetical protein